MINDLILVDIERDPIERDHLHIVRRDPKGTVTEKEVIGIVSVKREIEVYRRDVLQALSLKLVRPVDRVQQLLVEIVRVPVYIVPKYLIHHATNLFLADFLDNVVLYAYKLVFVGRIGIFAYAVGLQEPI